MIYQLNAALIGQNRAQGSGRKRHRGMTLIELGIVIAVIGILAVLALRGTSIMGKSKGAVEGQNMFDTINAVQSCFTKATNYAALGASATTGTSYAVINCGTEVANAPATSTVSGTTGTITNQFGGVRTILKSSINGGTDNAVTVTETQVPSDICQEVVQGQWGNVDSITVTPTGGTAVTVKASSATAYTPAALKDCKTATTATIALTKAKN